MYTSNTYRNTTRLVNDNVTIGASNDLDRLFTNRRFMTMYLVPNDILILDACLTRRFFSIDRNQPFINGVFLFRGYGQYIRASWDWVHTRKMM